MRNRKQNSGIRIQKVPNYLEVRNLQEIGGFTFIELLVSVTIMAILMGAAIVSYSSTSVKSRDAKRLADMQTIRAALEICRANTGSYPATITNNITCSDSTVTLADTPDDPKPSPYVQYSYSRPTVTTYTLICDLEGTGSCSYTQP